MWPKDSLHSSNYILPSHLSAPEQALSKPNRLVVNQLARENQIKFIDWHVEVIISSQVMKKVLKPLIILTFVNGKDERNQAVLTGEQFMDFRKKLGETIMEMHKLEKMPLMG